MTRDEAVTCLMRVPYPEHISEIDTSDDDAVRFTWRDDRFRISLRSMTIEQVEGPILSGSNLAILMERIIRAAWMNQPKATP